MLVLDHEAVSFARVASVNLCVLGGRRRRRRRNCRPRKRAEMARTIDQKPTWIANGVAEVQPNVCHELREGHSAKLQSVANEPESMLRQKLTFTAGERDQFRFRRKASQSCA